MVCEISQKWKIKFSNNCHIFILGGKIHVLDPRPVSVRQNRSRAIFRDVWLGHQGHCWCHKPSSNKSHQFVQLMQEIGPNNAILLCCAADHRSFSFNQWLTSHKTFVKSQSVNCCCDYFFLKVCVLSPYQPQAPGS